MDFQPLRLDTMLKDLPLRAKSFDENLIIDVNLIADHIDVNADPTRLAQVFDNLLSNAVKYAPGSNIDLSLDKQDNLAHIAFSDNGEGIPIENLPNIFTRFYRVPSQNRAVRGTGLGLFICRMIINAHGGEISAESNLGEGATFHIFLPLMNLKSGEENELIVT